MRILAIIGSPRKGNSFKITRIVEDKMKEYGDVEFDYLFLKDINLGQCSGCHKCISYGEDHCPYENDIKLVEEKILSSHGIIISSPIYMYQITSLMKTLFDRLAYVVHRPKFFNIKAMVLVLRGGMFKSSIKYVKKVARSWGLDVACDLGVPELESLKPKFKAKVIRETNASAEKFYKELKKNKLRKPSLYDLIWFRIWKINAIACKDNMPADYEYWLSNGWFDKNYFYDTRINIFKSTIANLVGKMAKGFMAKMFIGY